MSVAKEIAELVGWPHWRGALPVTERKTLATVEGDYVAPVWDPEHDLNHLFQALELGFDRTQWFWELSFSFTEENPYFFIAYQMGQPNSGIKSGAGKTIFEAGLAALRSAGPKEESDAV